MTRSTFFWRLSVVAAVVAAALLAVLGRSFHGGNSGMALVRNKIAVVPIYDEIRSPEEIVRVLKRYRDNVPGVKAVVLAINSPGGGVAAAQEICETVQSLKDEDIVVVAALGSIAASGGYYIACGADRIVANSGTLTGSIGVIMESMNAKKILDKVGLDFEVIKSGEFKDAGSFARGLTPRERVLFQGVIDDVYGQFIDIVSTNRREPLREALAKKNGRGTVADKISDIQLRSYVRGFADGRVFSGRKAMELGLVDELGGLEKAIEVASDLADLDHPEVVTYRPPRPFGEWLTGISKADVVGLARQSLGSASPRFGYFAW
jgi:protease-4